MKTTSFPYSELDKNNQFYSKFFQHYVSPSVEHKLITENFFEYDLYDTEMVQKRLEDIAKQSYQREALVQLLLKQNNQWNASEHTIKNINLLKEKNTVAVVTGQQLGIATGSLYTIYKTLSTLLQAEYLNKKFPTHNFVPIFWLEAEDHDFEEAASLPLFQQGKVEKIMLDDKSNYERQMVGRIRFNSKIENLLSLFLLSLPQTDFKSELEEILTNLYIPENTFLISFAKLLHILFKDTGLLLLSPDDREIKKMCVSLFEHEITNPSQTAIEVIKKSAELEDEGYTAQIKAKTINLFYIENNYRYNIECENDSYTIVQTKKKISQYEFLDLLQTSPEKFSPNVVLRPIVQDTILPTLMYIGGPSEINYFAQLKSVYQSFHIKMPIIMPRFSATILESKIVSSAEYLQKIYQEKIDVNIDYSQILIRILENQTQFQKELITAVSEIDIEKYFLGIEKDVIKIIQKIKQDIAKNDTTYNSLVEKSNEKIMYHFTSLKNKAVQNQNQEQEVFINHINKIYTNTLPNQKLQERILNGFYFMSKYGGISFIKTLQNAIDTDYLPNVHYFIEM